MRWVCVALAFTSAAILAGCAHTCGYVDVRTKYVPLGGATRTERSEADRPIHVVRDVTDDNPTLVVRAEALETRYGPARRETYGRKVVAPWRWYAPLLKPLASLTVVLPFYLSFRDPHTHDDLHWGLLDYLRDVGAWFNPFSAVPTGPRRMALEETLISSDTVTAPLSEKVVPEPGWRIALLIDGKEVAEAETDADGIVRFDLRRYVTAETASHDRKVTLLGRSPSGGERRVTWTLPRFVLRGILRSVETPNIDR